ncbi:2-oxoglutarate ferredoxin oxidoreductase subunit beta [Lipingzhangella halophila]|uniref:2-oxoglutarate ferredoxin oxidoreductase subunit beta n=1 Tax=Lipingzhangella halophila TaxID=1783352 RepID=A0A7W7W131_9ACTN|nr:2-oxoglutarate ferredoxin oxidoreductase subunit beta [Lipingzhangella halophila]
MPSENGSDAAQAGGNGAVPNGLKLVPRSDVEYKMKDFKSDQDVRWCPGCGDYAILAAFQGFLPELGVPRENIVMVSGIGCSSRFPYYLSTYGMHSIHGRAPAIATGLAASRPDLSVWVITGDGDGLSIGGNHLIHALRRNVNINVLLFNNRIYGLTKGQYSPTSATGMVTRSSPMGSLDSPFNPVSLALGAEAGFVARTVDSDRKHLTSVLRAAADHEGASFVEIYQNCPVFNDEAFEPLKDSAERDSRLLRMEHGEPLRVGDRGVVVGDYGELAIADVAEVGEENLVRHDAHRADPGYAFALSRLDLPAFEHVPVGVFRDVKRPTYDELMAEQLETAGAGQGDADLAGLLASGDTWTVEG